MHWLKTFNRVAAGSLAILLTSCASIKAPKTLFITFGVGEENFKDESAQIRLTLNKYTEAFKHSNPGINLVWINYKLNRFFDQIDKDSALDLGPDLVITSPYSAKELLARNLTTSLSSKQYFDSIYSPRIQAVAKINNEYSFAPWLIDTQIACFNKTKVEASPKTTDDLKELSASGKKIGLASNTFDLRWTAGTQGAISELSSLGSQSASGSTYPAIQKWLQWLQRAALYHNISFHKDARELSNKLKNNELDWVTCYGIQLEDLKKTMGNSLGVAALPNGSTSKAFPMHIIYGFSLGKNSSPTQSEMAMKFIMANVNTIAQRKLQLDNTGFLAVNQNVSIDPKSSRWLDALNTSFNEQSKSHLKELPGLRRYFEQNPQAGRTLADLIDGSLNVDEALKILTTPQTN